VHFRDHAEFRTCMCSEHMWGVDRKGAEFIRNKQMDEVMDIWTLNFVY